MKKKKKKEIDNSRVQKILIKKESTKQGYPTEKEVKKFKKECVDRGFLAQEVVDAPGFDCITFDSYFDQIDALSLRVRNLYNHANYIQRQHFFKTGKYYEYGELEKIVKKSEPYQSEINDYYTVGSTKIAQATLRLLVKNWKSYEKATERYKTNPEEFTGKPKPPKYKKGDYKRAVIGLTNNCIKNKDGYVYFTVAWLNNLNNTFRLTNESLPIYSARFVPVGGDNTKIEAYSLEIIQKVDLPKSPDVPDEKEDRIDFDASAYRIAGIDLGINNLATVVTNFGAEPFVINGRPLKSINAYYNKRKAAMTSELKKQEDKDWSRKLTAFTQKRNRKVEDYIHKATALIVRWCKVYEINIIVCGHNKGWKQESNMGTRNNQTFVCIPHAEFIKKLKYKCEGAGICFIETEEAYTSGTSFLDGEEPSKEFYNKKRRKHRGLFVSNDGIDINADVNGAYQIIKKEFPDAYAADIDYGRHPVIVNV